MPKEKVKKMKYFNGNFFLKGEQVPGFICAKTKRRALELLNQIDRTSRSYFRDYWSDVGTKYMMKEAKDEEGLWVEKKRFSDEYKKIV